MKHFLWNEIFFFWEEGEEALKREEGVGEFYSYVKRR